MKRLFVTGTDTGVGKTAITCALAVQSRAAGQRVVALKPAESGCAEQNGRLVAADAKLLRLASGDQRENCRYRYRAALAPAVAARMEGERIELPELVNWTRDRIVAADVALVEGAGGWAVPLSDTVLISDFARALELPVLVVARAGLGTVNHTLLTLRAVIADGCQVAGFAFSEVDAIDPAARDSNVAEVRRLAKVARITAPYWGVLGHGRVDLPEGLELAPAAVGWLAR